MAAQVSQSVATMPSATKDAPPCPKKRRRRAPTTGAADDCFACHETQSSCDRRRPYCTQCIDRGKTCSGYKTQLTWGVGVASRGKLRGLSLPVAKSKKAIASEKEDAKRGSMGSATARKSSTASTDAVKQEVMDTLMTGAPAFSSAASTPTTFGFINVDPHASMHSTAPMPPQNHAPYNWTTPFVPMRANNPSLATSGTGSRRGGIRRHSMQPLQMPTTVSVAEWSPAPMTAGIFGGFHDSAIADSPVTPSYHGPEPMAIPKSYPQNSWGGGGSFPDSYGSIPSIQSWQSDAVSSSLSSDTASAGFHEEDVFYADPDVADALDGVLDQRFPHRSESRFHHPPIKEEATEDDQDVEQIATYHAGCDGDTTPTSVQPFQALSSMLIGKTPALRQLINYYDKVIAPVIVAFDGPTNPYRTQILRMAHDSEALQHAIAALSASNLRMRRDQELVPQLLVGKAPHENAHDVSVRKSSIAHNMLSGSITQSEVHADPAKPSQTELHHKEESIKALNRSLRGANTTAANDDTVLATLLVLCLYHICDTGVAKFKTQFAGVKKLIALRSKSASSSNIQWLLTMFQWFDAMTATVNDREGQFEICGLPFSTTLAPGTEEWSLENLAGCDSRLFKTISQLGRLNLLSQGKPVQPSNLSPFIQQMPPRNTSTDYYSLPNNTAPSAAPQPRFDGNGWSSLLPDPDPAPTPARAQFHTEWAALRQQLLDWRFDPSTLPPSMLARGQTTPNSASIPSSNPNNTYAHQASPAPLPPLALDLLHISESFRYSALLYTERLAHPSLPSSAPNFQSLVQRAIGHIRVVKSDVYLLWPLFITGTECVDEEHRDLVRARCRAIQSDSGFYNNESTLGLLERVWAGMEAGGGHEDCAGEMRGEERGREEPFKWRSAMRREDGEYIVI